MRGGRYIIPYAPIFLENAPIFPENNAADYDECCLKYFGQDTQHKGRVFYIDGNRN